MVRKAALIDAPANVVWAAFTDLAAVHERLLPDRVAATRVEGDVRILTLVDGGEARERIVAVDGAERRLAYAVLAGGRMPLTHHHASFQVFDEGEDRSRLVWITDLLPDSLAGEVSARMEVGLREMKHVLERTRQA